MDKRLLLKEYNHLAAIAPAHRDPPGAPCRNHILYYIPHPTSLKTVLYVGMTGNKPKRTRLHNSTMTTSIATSPRPRTKRYGVELVYKMYNHKGLEVELIELNNDLTFREVCVREQRTVQMGVSLLSAHKEQSGLRNQVRGGYITPDELLDLDCSLGRLPFTSGKNYYPLWLRDVRDYGKCVVVWFTDDEGHLFYNLVPRPEHESLDEMGKQFRKANQKREDEYFTALTKWKNKRVDVAVITPPHTTSRHHQYEIVGLSSYIGPWYGITHDGQGYIAKWATWKANGCQGPQPVP